MSGPWAAITYLIYIILWESAVIGGCAYVVFWLGHSGWWFILAVLLSASAYKPNRWAELVRPRPSTEGE